jgi:exopolysaccharide biosynthesis polyprenyl glycosylphosphotransferase
MTFNTLLNSFLIRRRKLLILLLDYFVLLASIITSHIIFEFPKFGVLPNEVLPLWISFLAFLFFIQTTIFYIADFYTLPNKYKTVLENLGLPLGICSVTIFCGIAVFCYLTKFSLGRDVLLLATLLSWIGSLIVRLAVVQIFSPKYLALVKPIKCLVLGSGPLTQELKKQSEFLRSYEISSLNEIIEVTELLSIIQEEQAEIILLDSSSGFQIPDKLIDELIKLKFRGIQIIELGTFFEKLTSRVPLLHLPGHWFLNSQIFNEISNQSLLRAKRIFDITISILLAPIAIILILLSCIIIKLSSPGKVIYSQTRVGQNGNEFLVYKLRSMVEDSEKDGAQWTTTNDPRITPFGKFIRATRIDELPQLWNIFKGEMSLIGPRPERPEFANNLKEEIPYYDLRHSVKPGLTGWAQVNEPLATPTDSLQKLEFDLFYIRHLSFWLEISIILKTIRVILMRKGR